MAWICQNPEIYCTDLNLWLRHKLGLRSKQYSLSLSRDGSHFFCPVKYVIEHRADSNKNNFTWWTGEVRIDLFLYIICNDIVQKHKSQGFYILQNAKCILQKFIESGTLITI